MSLLHAWPIFLGVAALALPLIVHWLTKPKPTRLPLSTLRFVREVVQQRRAQHRLRDTLILALRMLAIGCLAWAMARPLIGEKPLVSGDDEGGAVRVVLLDVSQSMEAGDHGIAAFERARARASTYLGYRPGLRANLIQGSATPRPVFDEVSTNFSALHEELARSAPRPERLQLQASIALASKMLAGTGDAQQRRELVVISDFQRTNWAAADFSVLPQDTLVQLDSVAPVETAGNLAILRVASRGRSSAGYEAQLEVEIGNYSPTARQIEVEVSLGNAAYRLAQVCPPHERTTLVQDIRLPEAGWQMGEARLLNVKDALAIDDRRAFVLDVRPRPAYALVTRQRANDSESSSYYLERALTPLAKRQAKDAVRVVRVDPAQWDDEALAATDLIVLDHPGKLTAEAIGTLSSLIRRGRAVLYVASEYVDASNLKQLADSAGTGLQMPVEFLPPPSGQLRQNLFLADIKREQAPFQVFGDDLTNIASSLRFTGGLASRQLENTLSDDVVAAYSDRSAFLVVTSSGAGTLAVLNAELASSSLPASPAFVPLIGELVERLLARRTDDSAALSGEPAGIYLPPDAGALAGLQLSTSTTTAGPTSTAEPAAGASGELIDETLGVMWRTPAAGPPGVYQVKRGENTVFAVATELAPEESDLRSIDPQLLKDRLAGGRTVHFQSSQAADSAQDTLWIWLAVGCVGVMLAELLALRYFRI